MLIKPKYINAGSTPLKYLKFLKVMLPISMLIRLTVFVSSFQNDPALYSIGFMLLQFIAVVVAAYGINSMKWYGVISLYVLLFIPIADAAISVLIYLYCGMPEETGSPIGVILGYLIWLIPTWVYFSKRRLLFNPYPENAKFSNQYEGKIETSAIPVEKKEVENERWYTCQKCGQLVREGETCDCTQVKQDSADNQYKEAPTVLTGTAGKHPEKYHGNGNPVNMMMIFLCAILLICVGAIGYKNYSKNAEMTEMEERIKTLESENAKLKEEQQNERVYITLPNKIKAWLSSDGSMNFPDGTKVNKEILPDGEVGWETPYGKAIILPDGQTKWEIAIGDKKS